MIQLFLTLCCLLYITVQQQTGQKSPYSYSKHGSDWQGLCDSGKRQSPINIEGVKNTCDNSMVLDMNFYGEITDVTMEYTHALVISIPTGQRVSDLFATDVDGNLYGYFATSIEVHAPAEHRIDNTKYDAEVQIIHQVKSDFKNAKKKYAIISFLFEVDDTSKKTAFFENFDVNKAGTTTKFNFNLEATLKGEFNDKREYFTYQGSKTIPDCDEDVNWYVFKHSLKMTNNQLKNIQTFFVKSESFSNFEGNNREIQSKNGRQIKRGNIKCQEQFIYFFSFFILYIFINYFIFKLL